ncbi:hypothetical protein Flexsi_0238 [Flexistipes sinusarabici DSM 4947]|uniref:Uncharacterized protein n=1 Tax=Flexistipes sinusarabici (strain ATCC 49648 / DSM 4947 / MAS 10) TaxID=717231 RepID=F8E806_FLESM|nr:hypothetical protein Flexsi_0238 [Flexistipes sinusarabici DSM 4947]
MVEEVDTWVGVTCDGTFYVLHLTPHVFTKTEKNIKPLDIEYI